MKIVAAFLVGLLCGAAVVWWLVPGRYRHLYQTTQPLTLLPQTLPPHALSDQVQTGCILPEGTPLIADVKLTRTPDLGWWGFAPVIFDDMWKAQDLGVVPWDGDREIWERITLRAAEFAEAEPPPDSEEPQDGDSPKP